MARFTWLVVALCFPICGLPAEKCSGEDVERAVKVLKSVDDFGGLLNWLDMDDDVNDIETYCDIHQAKESATCCRRELVERYCKRIGLYQTLFDIAKVLEHKMNYKKQADALLLILTPREPHFPNMTSFIWTWLTWLLIIIIIIFVLVCCILFRRKCRRMLRLTKKVFFTVGIIMIGLLPWSLPKDNSDIPPTPLVYAPPTSAHFLVTSAHYLPTSPSNVKINTSSEKQLSPLVSKYAQYLRAEYDNILGSLPDKLPFTLGNEYVRLTVVRNELDTQAKADEFHQKYRGDINKILIKREEIEVEDILKPDEDTRLVLIEGEPGIGKTTLAVELCHQWQNHRLLQQFSLVVFLRLREESVKFATDIKDFFFHPDEKFRDQLVDEMKESLGENVLLIFDGFDEFPIELRQKSLVMDMIRGTKYLPEATILVTSRPSALAELQPLLKLTISKHIEIVGFTEESIYKAASKVFNNHELFSNFSAYLSANPVVRAIMYNPLNSVIVLNMYRQNFKTERPIPHTLTQLYTELSRSLISSYLSGIGDPLVRELPENIKDLPKDLYFQLLKISELAFSGTVTGNKEIFEKLPENCSSGLGLLIEYSSLFSVSKTVKYIFFHRSLQEYLSAFYISELELDKQREFINMSLPHQAGVVRFIAGLVKMEEIGWDIISTSPCFTGKIQINPLLLTCFYEAHALENCFALLEKRCIYISLTGYEMYALGYTISMCGRSWNLTLQWTTASGFEMLVHGLKNNEYSTGLIQTLDLRLSREIIKYLPLLPQSIIQKIETLSLIHCDLTKGGFQNLAQFIPQLHSLTALTISDNPGGPGSLVDLMKSLKTKRRIEYLSMDHVDIGTEDVTALSDLVISSNSLKWLRVGGMFFVNVSQIHTQQELVKVVLSPSSLMSVEIVLLPIQNNISVLMEGVDVVSNRLESLSLLHANNLRQLLNAEKLWHLLAKNISLKQLTLGLTLSEQDIESMVLWLKENNSLETLQLFEHNKKSLSNKVQDPRIKFVKSVQHPPNLRSIIPSLGNISLSFFLECTRHLEP